MASILPAALPALGQIGSALGPATVLGHVGTALGAAQLLQGAFGLDPATRQAEAEAKIRRAELETGGAELQRDRANAEIARKERLKQALATQRATMAGAGISTDGSGAVVRDNLKQLSARERNELDHAVALGLAGNARSLARARLSLLEHRDPLARMRGFVGGSGQLLNLLEEIRKKQS